jgi:hypothetical protein
MSTRSQGSTTAHAGASATTSVPASRHTIYVTFQPKVPRPGHPFDKDNLSHEYRSVGVCSGLSDGSAKERLDTMYGLYQVVKHQYDRLYWKSDTWETDSESESESEDDHEDHQSRVRRFRETFDSLRPEWQKRHGKWWEKATWIKDEHRADGPIMLSETGLVILTEQEFSTRFPSTPGEYFEVVRDYPNSQPGEVVMNFEEDPSEPNPFQSDEVVMDLEEIREPVPARRGRHG